MLSRKAIIAFLSGLVGAAGISLSIAGLSNWPPSIVAYAGLASVIFLSLIAISLTLLGWHWGTSRIRDLATRFHDYKVEPCKDADLDDIASIGAELFNGQSSDPDHTRRLHSLDAKTFTTIKDQRTGKVVGYVCLIRLSDAGIAALERREFDGARIPKDYVRSDNQRRSVAYYVGAVCGKNKVARALALQHLESKLKGLRPSAVYAKAATDDGLRLLKRNGFRTVANLPEAVGALFCRVKKKKK